MAGRSGVEWFPMDTYVLTDDEKVYDLMEAAADSGGDDAAFAAFGRWMGLICRIYREGPALQLDGRGERKLARDLGLTRDGLLAFLSHCVDSGLLDRDLWERERVLTSRGIQRRWCEAKKRTSLYVSMSAWSLLDGASARPSSGNSGNLPSTPEMDARDVGCSENSVLDKKRREEIRGEETREEESSSSSATGRGNVPPCMARTSEDGTWYADDADGVYPTIGEALQARYAHRTGLADFPEFVARVAKRCPPSCRGDPQRASHCHALLAHALDRYEPAKGSSPLPLALKIIDEDRGF